MTKLRKRPAAPAPAGDDYNDLADIARNHSGRSTSDSMTRTAEDAEREALPAQRAAYEKVMGKKLAKPAPRRDMAHADERGGDEDEAEEEERPKSRNARELEELDRSDEDDDPEEADEEDLDEPAGDDEDEDADDELQSALKALKRVKAPRWVFDEPRTRVLELAGSLASWQANADRALQSKDETIQALARARQEQAREDAREGGHENRDNAGDLETSAEELARALGLANDPETKAALVKYAKAGRGTDDASKAEIARLERTVQNLLVSSARKKLARRYEQLRRDPEAIAAFEKRVEEQARTGRYGQANLDRLFADAALLEFGPPKRSRFSGERQRDRKARIPAVQERRALRKSEEPRAGTEEHDRAVFHSVMNGKRRSLSSRR